jgi:hypothetical protein
VSVSSTLNSFSCVWLHSTVDTGGRFGRDFESVDMFGGGRRGVGDRAARRLDDRVAILACKSRTVLLIFAFDSVQSGDNDKGTIISSHHGQLFVKANFALCMLYVSNPIPVFKRRGIFANFSQYHLVLDLLLSKPICIHWRLIFRWVYTDIIL